MGGRDYRDLVVWQRAMDLVEAVYGATSTFPRDELFGLTQQLRRAVVSIPSYIAEGQGRGSAQEFRRFLSISHGSLREAETQLLIAERLKYIEQNVALRLVGQCADVGRLINGLRNSLDRRESEQRP